MFPVPEISIRGLKMSTIPNAILILLFAAALSGADRPTFASRRPFFSKRLADGSTLVVEVDAAKKTVQEKVRDTPDGPRRLVSVQLFEYHCRLLKVRDKQRETVWETRFTTPPSGVYPEFTVKDADLFQGKVYLLYTLPNGFLRLRVLSRDPWEGWTTVMAARLEDRVRALQKCRLFQESGGVGIACRGENVPSGDAREEVWDIRDGALHKRPRK
jgi:hypothetical protein